MVRPQGCGWGMNGERGFRVLLMAMPDVASCFDRVMRFPNLGLASLAGQVEEGEVRILDLVAHSRGWAQAVREAVSDFRPDLVGLSAMTFQYDTAKQVAALGASGRAGGEDRPGRLSRHPGL